jgi:hypothetical protein
MLISTLIDGDGFRSGSLRPRVYSAEAFEEHKKTPHFVCWVETTKNWLASPLEIATGVNLFPDDGVWKKAGLRACFEIG